MYSLSYCKIYVTRIKAEPSGRRKYNQGFVYLLWSLDLSLCIMGQPYFLFMYYIFNKKWSSISSAEWVHFKK